MRDEYVGKTQQKVKALVLVLGMPPNEDVQKKWQQRITEVINNHLLAADFNERENILLSVFTGPSWPVSQDIPEVIVSCRLENIRLFIENALISMRKGKFA
ncbi:MAG: hypothetical protein PHP62_04130 [Candidatus Moranbacteria bacterium]|nr:hypothetical protein [Candidatus Moranbacteria bacterium]